MFLLLVELEVSPAFVQEVENILRTLADVASKEAGNVYYAVHRKEAQPNAFVLYELYRDRSAWDTHLQSEPVQKALQSFERMLVAPPTLTFCDAIITTGIGTECHTSALER